MCAIIYLPVGKIIDYAKFENCVHNNFHSWGLILKNTEHKKLEVIRRCRWGENKANDPKEIFELLQDNMDLDRYLHLRFRTEGPIDMENTHPFPVYVSDKRQVYFMHNGSLTQFRPKTETTTYEAGIKVVKPGEDVSDSKKFCDELLAPLLLKFSGENGKADIHDPMLSTLIDKFWTTTSKGLLISNDQEPLFINERDWVKIGTGDNIVFASNNTYFDSVTRGPEFERRKQEKEMSEAKARSKFREEGVTADKSSIADLKTIPLLPRKILTDELDRIFEDYNIWEEKGISALDNITAIEFEALVKRSPDEAVNLLLILTGYYKELHDRHTRLVEHVEKTKKDNKKK